MFWDVLRCFEMFELEHGFSSGTNDDDVSIWHGPYTYKACVTIYSYMDVLSKKYTLYINICTSPEWGDPFNQQQLVSFTNCLVWPDVHPSSFISGFQEWILTQNQVLYLEVMVMWQIWRTHGTMRVIIITIMGLPICHICHIYDGKVMIMENLCCPSQEISTSSDVQKIPQANRSGRAYLVIPGGWWRLKFPHSSPAGIACWVTSHDVPIKIINHGWKKALMLV